MKLTGPWAKRRTKMLENTQAQGSGLSDQLSAVPAPWKAAVTEMVEAYAAMQMGIEDPILCHYNGLRLHNAMEDLRVLVLPGYEPKYEPTLDDGCDDTRADTEEGRPK